MASVSSRSQTASEELSVCFGPGTSARQVMNNQELATLIVAYFNQNVNPGARDDSKKPLVKLATLNKCFFHATTDLFWQKVPSLSPWLRLLPLYGGDDREKSTNVIDSLHKDPWGRFLLYHRKLVQLDLSDDRSIKDEMPNHWFFCLIHLPSAPATLFPKLTKLRILSLAGLNSVIPFYVSRGLRQVDIQDFMGKGKNKYDGLKKKEITSLLAGLSSNAPLLANMSILTPLDPSMTTAFPHFHALTDLSITLPSPVPLERLAHINALPSLKTLTLYSRGMEGTPSIPAEGQHLNEYHKSQGTAKLEELRVSGDGTFILWATIFFACPSLLRFRGAIGTARGGIYPLHGVFLIPHTLDILARRSRKIRRIGFYWDEPATDVDAELETWEDEPALRTPNGLFHAFSQLHDLTHLEISTVPFIAQDMALQLVTHAAGLKILQTMVLNPRPITTQPHHQLVLPTLEHLAEISANHPLLTYLRITLSLATVPNPTPGALPSIPGHPLKSLFVTPKYRPTNAPVSDAVFVATYVYGLFPQVIDTTSHFEAESKKLGEAVAPNPELRARNAAKKWEVDQVLQLWNGVNLMLKSYQVMRNQYAAQAEALRRGSAWTG